MGATAFRPRKSVRGQYKIRKEARLRGKPIKGRSHEPPPWYTFRIPGPGNPSNLVFDPVQRLERELTKFGEQSEFYARQRARAQAEREGLKAA